MSLKPPTPPDSPYPPGDPRSKATPAGGKWMGQPRGRAGFLPEPPVGEQEFDALTDLFLGEIGQRNRSTAEPSAPRPELSTEAARPRLRLRRDTDDDTDLPLPPPTFASPANIDDALGEIELPEPPISTASSLPSTPAAPADMAREPIVECIILGHLPVLGSAWATQYVREVAQAARRPVAVLRIQSGYASVEIIGAAGDDARRLPGSAPGVEAAVQTARSITDRWIVRCDADAEAIIASRPTVRVITLLTGGDEAARVGAYSSIKALAEHLSPPSDAAPGPLVRLAIMGAPDEEAQAAGYRIAETVRSFLGRDIEQVACASKIGSSRPPLLLYSGPADGSPDRILDLLNPEGAVSAPSPAPAEPAAETPPEPEAFVPAPTPHAIPEDLLEALPLPEPEPVEAETISFEHPEPVHTEPPLRFAAPPATVLVLETQPEPVEDVAPTPEPPAPLPTPVPEAPIAEVRIDERRITEPHIAKPEPQPIPEAVAAPAAPVVEIKPPVAPAAPAPAAEVPDRHPPLASHLPGLRMLPVQCPYADGVELAIDSATALHLLVRAPSEASDESVLAALFVASSWAESHATLLALALGAPLAAAGRPTLHLFTDRPKHSRRLLDTGVRVHLLATVKVGDRSGWFCTDLN